MSAREEQIRSLGTITLEAGWIDVCGDLGDLLDELIKAGWRAPEPPCDHVYGWQGDAGCCIKCGKLTHYGLGDDALDR